MSPKKKPVFEDPNFGHHYILLENLSRVVDDEMQENIVAKIQSSLPSAT